jgi:mono/diheme cytochrome c family protein
MFKAGLHALALAAILGTGAIAHAEQPGDAEAGAQVYEENCATCHGEKLRATGAAPDLKQLAADQRERFEKMVADGKGQMPSWSGVLSDEEKASIWAYIRSRAR